LGILHGHVLNHDPLNGGEDLFVRAGAGRRVAGRPIFAAMNDAAVILVNLLTIKTGIREKSYYFSRLAAKK